MENFNLSKISKRYIVISVSIILFTVLVLFIVNNSFYIITSSKSFTVKSITENGDKNIPKLLSLYVIPKDTESLRLESYSEPNLPKEEIIKPLTRADLGFGIKKFEAKFTPQYDIAVNSRDTEGCTYGDYPDVVNYRCEDPSTLIAFDASNPLDNGSYVDIPPTPINALINNIVRTQDRTLSAKPYKDGLLMLTATQISYHELPLGYLRLKYVDQKGGVTDISLEKEYGAFENGKYQLLTDSNGSDMFAIIDTDNAQVHIYKSTESESFAIDLGAPTDLSIANICGLNNGRLACYSGLPSIHAHSEEEQEHIESLEDGILSIYDTSTKEKQSSATVPKNNPISNLCLDKFGHLHTLTNSSIDVISINNDQITSAPIAYKADSISCGSKTHFSLDNKIYTIEEDGSAHLIYASDLLMMTGVQSYSDKLFTTGYYKHAPEGKFAFTAIEPSEAYEKPRVTDIVASIVDKHKDDLSFEARFTPKSIDYIVAKKFSPSGAIEDKDSIKSLQESTDIFKLDFKPTFHSAPNY